MAKIKIDPLHPSEVEVTRDTPKGHSNWRRAVLRGSSIIAPPLITLLLLIWLANAIEGYVLLPLESGVRKAVVWMTADIYDSPPIDAELVQPENPEQGFRYERLTYVQPPVKRKYLPDHIISHVEARRDELPTSMRAPLSAEEYYSAYIKLRYMPRWFTIPLLLLIVLCVLFFFGRFLAAGFGRFAVTGFERAIDQVPLIRNVYSSVKQVTDFVLSDSELEFTRVVAVEYPHSNIWSLAFLTGDSFPSLKTKIDEDMVSIFVPTSPMPMTGFTMNARRRDLVDVDITIDQAIQFIISCGVVCPPSEVKKLIPPNIGTLPIE